MDEAVLRALNSNGAQLVPGCFMCCKGGCAMHVRRLQGIPERSGISAPEGSQPPWLPAGPSAPPRAHTQHDLLPWPLSADLSPPPAPAASPKMTQSEALNVHTCMHIQMEVQRLLCQSVPF